MTGTATRPRVLMEWRFMYLLPDWFAATPARAAASRRNRLLAITAGQLPRMNTRSASIHPSDLIHCALRAHFRQVQNSRRRSRTGNSTSWQSSAFRFAGRSAGLFLPWRAVPQLRPAPICARGSGQCRSLGTQCRRRMRAPRLRFLTAGSPLRRCRESVRASRPLRTRRPSGSSCR